MQATVIYGEWDIRLEVVADRVLTGFERRVIQMLLRFERLEAPA